MRRTIILPIIIPAIKKIQKRNPPRKENRVCKKPNTANNKPNSANTKR